jgi:ketosteroid isomerase-like protein
MGRGLLEEGPMNARMRTLMALAVALAPMGGCIDGTDGGETTAAAELGGGAHCYLVAGDRLGMVAVDRLASLLTAAIGPEGFLAVADSDLVFLAPGQNILHGKPAVRDYLQAVDPEGATRFAWGLTRADVGASGRFGYTFGWTTVTTTAVDGTETTTHGKYANLWRRGGGGWRLIAHARTRDVAIEVTPAPPDFPLFPDSGFRCLVPEAPSAALAAELDADRDFAALSMASGEADAFGSYAAADAVLLGAGLPLIIGPADIAALYADDPPEDTLDWAPVGGAVASTGELGYTVGEAVYTDSEPGGDTRYYSKYVTIWEKQADGAWRYIADVGSSRPAP